MSNVLLTQVDFETRSKPVRTLQHLRSQADFCQALAHQMSDRHAAEDLRTLAAEYLAEADKLENQSASPPPVRHV